MIGLFPAQALRILSLALGALLGLVRLAFALRRLVRLGFGTLGGSLRFARSQPGLALRRFRRPFGFARRELLFLDLPLDRLALVFDTPSILVDHEIIALDVIKAAVNQKLPVAPRGLFVEMFLGCRLGRSASPLQVAGALKALFPLELLCGCGCAHRVVTPGKSG